MPDPVLVLETWLVRGILRMVGSLGAVVVLGCHGNDGEAVGLIDAGAVDADSGVDASLGCDSEGPACSNCIDDDGDGAIDGADIFASGRGTTTKASAPAFPTISRTMTVSLMPTAAPATMSWCPRSATSTSSTIPASAPAALQFKIACPFAATRPSATSRRTAAPTSTVPGAAA